MVSVMKELMGAMPPIIFGLEPPLILMCIRVDNVRAGRNYSVYTLSLCLAVLIRFSVTACLKRCATSTIISRLRRTGMVALIHQDTPSRSRLHFYRKAVCWLQSSTRKITLPLSVYVKTINKLNLAYCAVLSVTALQQWSLDWSGTAVLKNVEGFKNWCWEQRFSCAVKFPAIFKV